MKKLYFLFSFILLSILANAQAPFIAKISTYGSEPTIYLPVEGVNFTIDFGNGTVINNLTGPIAYMYSSPGIYTVTISGDFNRIKFSDTTLSASRLSTIEQWGDAHWISMEGAFEGCNNLIINASDAPDLALVTSMKNMFKNAQSLNQSLNNWNVSTVMDMEGLFEYSSFDGDISNWNMSNVITMRRMFYNTPFNQPIGNWDVSSVVDMQETFSYSQFNQPINNWNVSNVTNMQGMFYNASDFNQAINNWNVSNVTNMQEMFYMSQAFNQELDNWEITNVNNIVGMFGLSVFNQSLNSWDVSNITNMENLFMYASYNLPLDNWDVSNVTNMKAMFDNGHFNQPLNNWDVSNVLNMEQMFRLSDFNQPLNNWDVSNVTNMKEMFGNFNFNQSLDNWDVSNVTNMYAMFSNASDFNQPLNNWDVSNVTDMTGMFKDATEFNQPLNNWNVSNVLNMSDMFNHAESFNQDISQWSFNNDVSVGTINYFYENTFLGYTGMDTTNYDSLLARFAELGLENKILISKWLYYCDSGVRDYLINNLGWTIMSDTQSQNCINNILSGAIRFDENVNGCDVNDIGGNFLINAFDGTFNYSTFSSNEGEYSLGVFDGDYSISLLNVPDYFTVMPATNTVSFTGFGGNQTLDFCLTASEEVQDLNITLLPINQARPGFETNYQLVLQNMGTQAISGAQANLTYDSLKQSFVSAGQAPASASEGQLSFNIESIQPFETKVVNLIMQTFTPPTVNGDDVLNFAASITPNTGDYTPDDNAFEFAQVVVNSFDPNDKQVLQGEEITLEQKEEYLDYIIRFQNTGTASAIKVRVKDVLDAKLDWTTLKPVSASHSYKLEIKEDGQLEFIFNNINLPAQADDEEGSNGYIAYKIKPLQNVQVGNIITGSAEIYFDYNTPVITNTVSTEIVAPTAGLKSAIAAYVAIYPNPVNDLLYLNPKFGTVLESLSVFNLQGRELLTCKENLESVNLKNLSSGVYLLALKTNKGTINQRIIKK